MKLMRTLFTLLTKFYLKWNPKFFYTHKKHFLRKIVSFFWIDFTIDLLILQKSKVTNSSITILGYSNDKNTYIAKNIISID